MRIRICRKGQNGINQKGRIKWNSSKLLDFILVVGFLLLFTTDAAYAYIDPGIASFAFQMLIAGLVGSLFLIKLFWHKIKAFFLKYIVRR
ncbi:MAG: hypothetical protein ACOC7P_00315 [Chloroflexota bacterium]